MFNKHATYQKGDLLQIQSYDKNWILCAILLFVHIIKKRLQYTKIYNIVITILLLIHNAYPMKRNASAMGGTPPRN